MSVLVACLSAAGSETAVMRAVIIYDMRYQKSVEVTHMTFHV